jgi:hypothetical protein
MTCQRRTTDKHDALRRFVVSECLQPKAGCTSKSVQVMRLPGLFLWHPFCGIGDTATDHVERSNHASQPPFTAVRRCFSQARLASLALPEGNKGGECQWNQDRS